VHYTLAPVAGDTAVVEDRRGNHRPKDHVLATCELRRTKPSRAAFAAQTRNPITVVLDGVRQNYNLGAIFRLCDAFLAERLVICGVPVLLHKRRLVQAAAGTQRWVPWEEAKDAARVVRTAKRAGHWITVVELTANSVNPPELRPQFPAVLVLGGERSGVSPDVIACADQAVSIPMLGMANSLNVATAAAIILYELVQRCRGRGEQVNPPQIW
jgi:tRNA G18 (ribose-2'-O)-methylase SpoU